MLQHLLQKLNTQPDSVHNKLFIHNDEKRYPDLIKHIPYFSFLPLCQQIFSLEEIRIDFALFLTEAEHHYWKQPAFFVRGTVFALRM